MTPIQSIEEIARQVGLFPLREPQERAVRQLLSGQSLLLVWPTGSGKSLCYQLPGLVLDGMTVVISPLIALMDDQVSKGRKLGWPITCVHSGLKREERERRLKQVARGEIKLFYVTPERFRQAEFRTMIQSVKIALLAVDEAHCISQWGHDFRPDYSRVGEVRRLLGDPQVIALTATATQEVQEDILRQLHLSPAQTALLWEGVERPNLHLAVRECEGIDEKLIGLEEWRKSVVGAKIIYFTLISTLQKVSEWLAQKGVAHDVYHGDLEDGARRRSQAKFLGNETELLLATPAFGLGIDKPNVRGILHFEIPGSLESYFQEVGRAGRDQLPAHCMLLYWQEDLETQMRFIETLTPDPAYIRAVYNLLVSWQDRLSTLDMEELRAQLSFKNKRDFRLETALNILDRWDVIRWPKRRLNLLTILRPLEEEDLSEALWKARKLQLQKKLLALVQWVRSEECRKVVIYKYFGWPNTQACGFCDRCEAAE
jgi:ATP-dependent DNA helicase RecQ